VTRIRDRPSGDPIAELVFELVDRMEWIHIGLQSGSGTLV
jgi:hypothetical protein